MKKVVIIGAGPAGLTAAYYLLKNNKDLDVTILEQDSIVGGISKSLEFDGYRIDTGIHRFFSKNDEVNEIWQEILPLQNKPTYDEILLNKTREYKDEGSNPETDEKSFLIKDRITRIYYRRKFFDYPVTLNFNTLKNMGFINVIKGGFSYFKSICFKKPEDNLENFYINRFGKVLYQMFFESYTEKVWGRHPSQISADWGAQRVKGISISKVLGEWLKSVFKMKNKNTETSLINRFYYPKLGSGQMYEEMAKAIESMGGKILYKSKVNKIVLNNNSVKQIYYDKENKTYDLNADIVISSMPIKELFSSFEGIDIPEDIANYALELPYRSFMSVGVITDKLNLENTTKVKTLMDVIPDSWIYVQEPEVKMGRLQVFNNWSPYIFKNKEEIAQKVFISFEYFCDEDDEYWNMNDEDFIKFATDEASKIGLIDKNKVEHSIRIKVPKAYPAYFDSYEHINEIENYIDSIQGLYCIGRNGQHRYNNMDHSMLTGVEVAKLILYNSNDKKVLWNINTEKEYHEEK